MPEFQHYSTFDEAISILGEVLDRHHLRVIPEVPKLVEPRIESYDAVTTDVREKLGRYPVVELEGPFTKHPLEFERRASGAAAGTYYVNNAIGPRLRWVLSHVVDVDGRRVVTSGSLSFLDHYENPHTHQWEPASDELRHAYAAVVKTMKTRMTRVNVRKKESIWVGHQTKALIDAGELFIDR